MRRLISMVIVRKNVYNSHREKNPQHNNIFRNEMPCSYYLKHSYCEGLYQNVFNIHDEMLNLTNGGFFFFKLEVFKKLNRCVDISRQNLFQNPSYLFA